MHGDGRWEGEAWFEMETADRIYTNEEWRNHCREDEFWNDCDEEEEAIDNFIDK